MRRTIARIVVGVLFGGMAPVSAGPPLTSVTPNPVRQKKTITIIAYNCTSGPTWDPFVSISIVDSEGAEKYSAYVPGDDTDGVNESKVKIRKKKYPKGTYKVYVDCVHETLTGPEFDYQYVHELKVKKPKKK
ncbi:MAG: hypothetical protein GEU71_05350 [Actinobacteria bacterium]|jgi:hypothetical protein|nr:hypothetical protein [Actinomycetota bacterium]